MTTVETHDDAKPTDYHIRSLRLAHVVEELGGRKACDSLLMQRAVGALMRRGMTEDQIVAECYRARLPA